jgi:hypothetical protein
MARGERSKGDRENVYEMYVRNGNRAGFWVVRDSWTGVVALVRSIDRGQSGALSGDPPYYGNPPVRAGLWDWKLKRWRQKYYELSCPGTYAYRRVDRPTEEETPAVTGSESPDEAEHPQGRSEATEGSEATFAEAEAGGKLLPEAGVGGSGVERAAAGLSLRSSAPGLRSKTRRASLLV